MKFTHKHTCERNVICVKILKLPVNTSKYKKLVDNFILEAVELFD